MQQDFYLQITGKTHLEQPLKKDHKYSIAFKEVDIYGVNETSGQGDADKLTFKGKSVSTVTVIDEGQVIFGKSGKNSQSSLLRREIEALYDEQYAGDEEFEDSESFYKHEMSKLIEHYKQKRDSLSS